VAGGDGGEVEEGWGGRVGEGEGEEDEVWEVVVGRRCHCGFEGGGGGGRWSSKLGMGNGDLQCLGNRRKRLRKVNHWKSNGDYRSFVTPLACVNMVVLTMLCHHPYLTSWVVPNLLDDELLKLIQEQMSRGRVEIELENM
jgi:hypothetical protein